MRAGAGGALRHARARCCDRGHVAQAQRITRRDQNALLAPRKRDAPRHRAIPAHRRPLRDWRVSSSPSSRCRWMAATITSPRVSRRKPSSLPSGRLARPELLSRSAHSSSGSWLPPTIGGAATCASAAGAIRPADTQRSSAALGNSQRPVTLLQGTARVGHQLVKLALREPQIVGGFVGGEEFRHRHLYASEMQHVPKIDHIGPICARYCCPTEFSMPQDVTALQLVLSGDPALFAIVRLSLYVSLSAVALAALIGIPLGACDCADEIPRTPGRHRPAQRPDGPAAGGRRSRGLSGAVALRAARRVRPAVHAAGHDRRADRAGHADHRRAGAPDHRGSLDRIPRRTHRDESRPARPRHGADLGRALQSRHRAARRASAVRRRRSAPSSSSAAISKALPAR